MALTQEDMDFLTDVNCQLNNGKSPAEIAEALDMPQSTLRSTLLRLGYEIQINRSLIPKRAPDLDSI